MLTFPCHIENILEFYPGQTSLTPPTKKLRSSERVEFIPSSNNNDYEKNYDDDDKKMNSGCGESFVKLSGSIQFTRK
jgi:hypothetical protein